jgi:NAD(P)-dependent dehydrogenase (short-subunit alcohol dehydrogenase family)
MPRTALVTGAASGIGKATKELLELRGERVIGADLHDADVEADLSAPQGRSALVESVNRLSGGSIDAVYAIAGVALQTSATVAVNFFGTVATLEGLRPLLLRSSAPRAVLVSSMAALMPSDEELVALLASKDETAAIARAEILAKKQETGQLIYSSTKLALSRWVRRQAPTPARLLAWLNSEENTHLCGQIVYVDGGSDAVLRGDSVW